MRELFQWVPWFEELAKKVREVQREGLVERVNQMDWAGKKIAVFSKGENYADPLTFFYHLASIASGKAEVKKTIYKSVADVFGIKSPLDYNKGEYFIFPTPPALAVVFGSDSEDETQLLWDIFDQACRLDSEASEVDLTDNFHKMLGINKVGVPKLTQVLFLVNPRAFLPFDAVSILPLGLGQYETPPQKISWSEYLREMSRIREAFSGCQCYEINVICYLWNANDGNLPRENIRWYQINTTEDRCIDFLENNWVYYGKPGTCLPVLQQYLPLNKPVPGDVIFVHSGKRNVYGIGVVYRNDHHQSSHANGRIHVLWIKKKRQCDVDILTPLTPFSQVDMDSYQVYTNVPAYEAILGLLSGPTKKHDTEQWHEGFIRYTPPSPYRVTTPPIKADAKQWYKEQFGSNRVWVFKASEKQWNEFKEKHFIAIGWDDLGDLNEFHNRKDILKRLKELTGTPNPSNNALACYQFAHEMQPGDPVLVIMRGNKLLLGYGVIESDYTFDEYRPEGRHVRKITWKKTGRWQLSERRRGTAPKTLTDFSRWKWWVLFAFRLMEISNRLPSTDNHKLNQILYGPPGTGKTYSTTARAMAIVKGIKLEEVTEEHRKEFRDLRFDSNEGSGQIEMVTFHQNYSYEDFVEGIRPSLAEEGGLDYELRPGVFRKIVKAALDNPHCRFVLIIDEINRGNIPKILGDLITLIESSRRIGQNNETKVTLPYSGDSFGVPGNLFIIGTMNTADRSILPLDIALRRRFDHVEMMPNPDHDLISEDVDGINLRKMLKAINARISVLLDRERQIGHTYLFNVENIESLASIFKTAILPLLLEYFYDDWSKVQKVLGDAEFIRKSSNKQFLDHLKEDDLTDSYIYERIPWRSKKWEDKNQYRSIYEKTGIASDGEPKDEDSDSPKESN